MFDVTYQIINGYNVNIPEKTNNKCKTNNYYLRRLMTGYMQLFVVCYSISWKLTCSWLGTCSMKHRYNVVASSLLAKNVFRLARDWLHAACHAPVSDIKFPRSTLYDPAQPRWIPPISLWQLSIFCRERFQVGWEERFRHCDTFLRQIIQNMLLFTKIKYSNKIQRVSPAGICLWMVVCYSVGNTVAR